MSSTQTEYKEDAPYGFFDPQFVVVDVETHKTLHYEGKDLLGVAIGWEEAGSLYTAYVLPEETQDLWQWLRGKELICHNAAFDLRILEDNGFVSEVPVWDTMIMAHLIDENRFSYDLDGLAKAYTGFEKLDVKQFEKIYGEWHLIPENIMSKYAQRDAAITYKLWLRLRGALQAKGLEKNWKHAREYILTLKDVMRVGLPIDWQLADALSLEATSEMRQISSRLGFVPSKKKELEAQLFEKYGIEPSVFTPAGAVQVDDAALRYYATKYPETQALIADVLRYRNLMKADGTWYSGFQKVRTPHDRIHPGLKQHGTATGRLSCATPNLQQLPRDASRAKQLFVSDPGHVLMEFDYSQIELRLASYYAQYMFGDSTMYEAYKSDIDVHSLTTESVGATDRQVGKTGNFLWVYGGSAKRFRSMMRVQYKIAVSERDAYKWTEGFHRTYPGFRAASEYYTNVASSTGVVKMWSGRRRHFPDRRQAHKAWNSVIQGGCGQILMFSMNLLHKSRLRSRMCNTVHDSIWFMVPEKYMEEECQKIQELMRHIPEKMFKMPFLVDMKPLNG